MMFVVFVTDAPAEIGYGYIDSNAIGGPLFEWEFDDGDFYRCPKGDNEYNSQEKDVHVLSFDRLNDFSFEFYGDTYYGVYIGGNGYLTFSYRPNTNVTYDGSSIPSGSGPNNLIAALWGSYDTFD